MKDTIKIFSLIALVAIVSTSCKKDFLERPPLSNLTSENAIYDEASALSVIRGAYARLRTQKIYGDNYVHIAEVTSDDATNADDGGADEAYDDFKTNSTFASFQGFWQGTYEGVQRANNAIDVLKDSKYLDEATRKIVVGEAKFLRAYHNWLLVTVFGEVPLYEKTPVSVEDLFNPQVSVPTMYASIERDLTDALILPESWPADSKGRATKYAALAMLGKVYLYQQKWALAKEAFKKVKDSGKYRLLADHADNFNILKENGEESIFEIQNRSGLVSDSRGLYSSDGGIQGTNNYRGVLMSPQGFGVSFGQIIATRDLFNEFEPLDPRLRSSIYLRSLDTIYNGFPPKPQLYRIGIVDVIKGKSGGPYYNGSYFNIKKGVPGSIAWVGSVAGIESDDGTNIVAIRYADVLLMYAEAAAESGDLPLAIANLNEVRARAKRLPFPYSTTYGGHNYPAGTIAAEVKFPGAPVTYTANLEDFRKALVHERRVELAFEYHRFNDLVRWANIPNHPGSAFKVFASKGEPFSKSEPEDKKNFLESSKLFPKPLAEKDKSRGTIRQNPGY